jgi:hypothetical protein
MCACKAHTHDQERASNCITTGLKSRIQIIVRELEEDTLPQALKRNTVFSVSQYGPSDFQTTLIHGPSSGVRISLGVVRSVLTLCSTDHPGRSDTGHDTDP